MEPTEPPLKCVIQKLPDYGLKISLGYRLIHKNIRFFRHSRCFEMTAILEGSGSCVGSVN